MLQNAFWQTSCLHNSVDGVPMSATSVSPRSHADSFSLLVLPQLLTLNFRYNLYPDRALALLVHSPSPSSLLLLSQQTPSLLPFTFTSLTTEGSEETLHQLLTAASTLLPPCAPSEDHSSGWAPAFHPVAAVPSSLLHFQGFLLQATISLSIQVLCSNDPNL